MSDPRISLLNGMSVVQLQTALANAQQAYLDLSTGAKVETAAYTQGDGNKSVTYTRADLSKLTMLIRQLQMQLGMIHRVRRPAQFRF